MPEIYTTHYNLIDCLIKGDKGLWEFVCGVHSRFVPRLNWSEESVYALVMMCVEYQHSRGQYIGVPQRILSVYAESNT